MFRNVENLVDFLKIHPYDGCVSGARVLLSISAGISALHMDLVER